jgi:uncharacterized protein YdbL (DUF1318 family)
MKTRITPLLVTVTMPIILIFACVTINIYFPAEKVESVAGEIVEDIRGSQSQEDKESDEKEKSFFGERRFVVSLVPAAWAEDVTGVSNPTIRALKQQMKERFKMLKPWFDRGVLAEGNDGYVDIVRTDSLGLKEKNELRKLVAAENSDRKALYRAVAEALDIDPGQIDRIGRIFAAQWQQSLK